MFESFKNSWRANKFIKLNPDEIENYSQSDIKKSFRNFPDVDDFDPYNNSGIQKIY